jgi:hypothetical protein
MAKVLSAGTNGTEQPGRPAARALIAAGPMFFVSAWLLVILAGITHTDLGTALAGYLTAMVVTVGPG